MDLDGSSITFMDPFEGTVEKVPLRNPEANLEESSGTFVDPFEGTVGEVPAR